MQFVVEVLPYENKKFYFISTIRKGPYAWREIKKPTHILYDLCKRYNLPPPEYTPHCVKIGFKEFILDEEAVQKNKKKKLKAKLKRSKHTHSKKEPELTPTDKEVLALNALHRWKEFPLVGRVLVPEHIETRSLYHYSQPGIEQVTVLGFKSNRNCLGLPR